MDKNTKSNYNGWDITKGDYEISDDSTETYRNSVIKKKRFKKALSIIAYFVFLILVTLMFLAPL